MPDPLAGLKDIHLPDQPGWWPPAPGWWLLGLLSLLLALWLGWVLRRWWRSAAPRRAFERELAALPLEGDAATRLQTVGEMSRLARRFALTRFGRTAVAGLAGDAWLQFLDRTSGTRSFTAGPGRVLAYGPYRNPAGSDELSDLGALKTILLKWAGRCRQSSLEAH